jgi:hypothetical protein
MSQLGTDREPVTIAFLSWGDPTHDGPANLGELHFDAVLSETHTRTATVTEHSVEQGVAVVDHVRPNPDQVKLEVFVTNQPVYSTDASLTAITLDIPQPGDGSFLAGGTSALLDKGLAAIGLQKGYPSTLTYQVQAFDADVDYVQNCFDTLTRLKNTATLLKVATPRQFYENMVIENIEMRRSPQTGSGAAMFNIDLRQIRIVTSRIVQAPLPAKPDTVPTVPKGKKDVTNDAGSKQSVFAKIADALRTKI